MFYHEMFVNNINFIISTSGPECTIDMCEDINCGIGGSCFGGYCTCQTGYANVENFCEEM